MAKGNEVCTITQIDFNKVKGITCSVVPVIIQDNRTKKVLLLAYTDESCLKESLQTGLVCLWSTSRNKRWLKGQTSGDYLQLCEVRLNCDSNSLLYLVKPLGHGVCHTKINGLARSTCFFSRVELRGQQLLQKEIKPRRKK
ncbi:MAG: phosphoribosyl-AMP cyclohydrolase [Candidatus Parcubacteria bacterium]|nr:phosphoribosyl-AMP cyclohydrolase [Candidatus Parcubacteria bacterium]